MATDLQQGADTELAIVDALAKASEYAARAMAPSTLRVYRSAWLAWSRWCAAHGAEPLPADPVVICAYLADRADEVKAASLHMALVAIRAYHKAAGEASPINAQVQLVMSGIRRTHATAKRQRKAMTPGILRQVIKPLRTSHRDIRDRAILTLGVAAALRRSELSALTWADVEVVDEGIILTIERSKTDQVGAGTCLGIVRVSGPLCSVRALQQWRILLDDPPGDSFIFRRICRSGAILGGGLSGASINNIVRQRCKATLGEQESWGAHSLRAGLPTEAAKAGRTELDIMRQTRHRSSKGVQAYIRAGQLFEGNLSVLMEVPE